MAGGDGGGEETLAAAALAVALVALLGTIGQVLQQYFGTADGYRRCQSSVLGPWAGRTRLKFRWSQFRLETLFTVPHIMLRRALWVSSAPPECPFEQGGWILGRPQDAKNADEVNLLISGSAVDKPELVTWLRFLRSLQWTHKMMTLKFGKVKGAAFEYEFEANELKLVEYENRNLTLPIVKFEERSWDFMPPDVVKPYARISVSDLGVLARRLGMEWDRFEPAEGVLRAQGNGYSLNSVLVRSVGTMVEFNEILGFGTQNTPLPWSPAIPENVDRKTLLIPCAAADKMAFGILPGVSSDFLHRDFDVHDLQGAIDLVRYFTADETLVAAFAAGGWPQAGWCPGVSDLLSFIAPMMYRPEVGLSGVPSPDNGFSFHGVTAAGAAFVEFENRLRLMLEGRSETAMPAVQKVYGYVQRFRNISEDWTKEDDPFKRYFADQSQSRDGRASVQHDIYMAYRRSTGELMKRLPTTDNGKHKGPNYFLLIKHHLLHMFDNRVDRFSIVEGPISLKWTSEYALYPDALAIGFPPWAKRMGAYFDRLPGLVDDMVKAGHGDGDDIRSAWVLMMFRGMCWNRCHVMISGKTLPMRYCGSQMPVYLG